MKQFLNKRLTVVEASEVQGSQCKLGWCGRSFRGTYREYPIAGCNCLDAQIKCLDHTGEYDKLENYGTLIGTDGGWWAQCRINYGYYGWGW